MRLVDHKLDFIFLIMLIIIIVGLPFGIRAYDRRTWHKNVAAGTKEFELTGHTQRGWIPGKVYAYDAISFWKKSGPMNRPLIKVSKGDQVVLKLTSSDVIHGFSLKDFGVFITEGIQPGKVTLVSFKADKAGIFTFSCNAICGDNHKNMQGILVVTA